MAIAVRLRYNGMDTSDTAHARALGNLLDANSEMMAVVDQAMRAGTPVILDPRRDDLQHATSIKVGVPTSNTTERNTTGEVIATRSNATGKNITVRTYLAHAATRTRVRTCVNESCMESDTERIHSVRHNNGTIFQEDVLRRKARD